MKTKLTAEQKLEALALKYYNCLTWEPKKGDYYTTSRSDKELYQIVDENENSFFTNYCDKEKFPDSENAEWSKQSFLQDFGERRVYVPDYVLAMES